MTGASLSNLTAIYWNELVIDFKTIDIIENPKTIADWLRYYRKLNNISRRQLELNSGISLNSIKKYEDKNIYPTKEVSKKLALYFKLNTKYFYDPFYEYLEKNDIVQMLKDYRGNNTLKSTAAIINIHAHTLRDWECRKRDVTREGYEELKRLGIIP